MSVILLVLLIACLVLLVMTAISLQETQRLLRATQALQKENREWSELFARAQMAAPTPSNTISPTSNYYVVDPANDLNNP